MVEALNESEIEHIIGAVPLKLTGGIQWTILGGRIIGTVSVEGARRREVGASLVLDISISRTLPGKYKYQVRQIGGPVLRRLDVRASHTNRPHTGSSEHWERRTHKHTFRDSCGSAFAYSPDDIPDTTSPSSHPSPGEHRAVFVAFCGECGIEPGDAWRDPWEIAEML